jgi:hypothetical protein
MTIVKRFSYISVLIFFLSLSGIAQRDTLGRKKEKSPFDMPLRERFYWGGNLGAWFGSTTFIDISPLLGVKITEKASVGLGFIYNYYSYNYLGAKYSTNMYGSRVYGRYFILENIFLQAGWDKINRDNPYAYSLDTRVWVDNLLVGGGLRLPIGNNFYGMATGLWNLNQGPLSPYANPIIQVGFVGGF